MSRATSAARRLEASTVYAEAGIPSGWHVVVISERDDVPCSKCLNTIIGECVTNGGEHFHVDCAESEASAVEVEAANR